jgi:DNA-binding response OmpR family regulator
VTPPLVRHATGRHVVVADADPKVVQLVIETLRQMGHAVFHAYDGRSAVELVYSLSSCDLVISNTNVGGVPGIDLIHQLRRDYPALPILYLANLGFTSAEIEAELPEDIPILREPFQPAELRAMVSRLLKETPG